MTYNKITPTPIDQQKKPKQLIHCFSFLLSFILLAYTTPSKSQQIFINEIMSKNAVTLFDFENTTPDWIELFNNSETTINLTGFFISDDDNQLKKWMFPNTDIPPKQYLLIYASGKNLINNNELHTNFKISSAGENIFLADQQGNIIDQVQAPPLTQDESFIRKPDASTYWTKTKSPTPGSTNNKYNNLLFSHLAGFYSAPLELEITSQNNDSIFYTTNGSLPTQKAKYLSNPLLLEYRNNDANIYSEIVTTAPNIDYPEWHSPGFNIDKAHVIRCASFRNGKRTSQVYTMTYFIDLNFEKKYNLPVISLITDSINLFDYNTGIYVPGKYFRSDDPNWTGNFFQKGDDWERQAHIEFFTDEKSMVFSQDAGIRTHGFKTRSASQKSLKLYAREEYGEKYFNHQLLPQKELNKYKRFVLQTSMGAWGGETIFKDALAHDIVRNLNLEIQDFQPTHVFINGEYWGIQTIRDRLDGRYLEYTTGVDKDSVDIIQGNIGLIEAGSNKAYIELAQFIEKNDLEKETNYQYVTTKIDIYNFIDYIIAEHFLGNADWPGNNQRLWREQTPSGKWRWIFFDLDAAFGNPNKNMMAHTLQSNIDSNTGWQKLPASTYLLRNLIKNENFVSLFVSRYDQLLNETFSQNNTLKKLNDIKHIYEEDIALQIARWKYPKSVQQWETDIYNNITQFLTEREPNVLNDISHFFALQPPFSENYPNEETNISNYIITAPNPSNGIFFIQNQNLDFLNGQLSIYDLTGKIIYKDLNFYLSKNEQKRINLSNYPKGSFIMHLKNSKYIIRKPIIIQ